MKLIIGLWGILLPTRREMDARGFVVENFINAPPNEEAFSAFAKFIARYGPGSLGLIAHCQNKKEGRLVWEWLEHHNVVYRLRIAKESDLCLCPPEADRRAIALKMGAIAYLEDCPTLLRKLPLGVERLLFAPGRVPWFLNKTGIVIIRSWIQFERHFSLWA